MQLNVQTPRKFLNPLLSQKSVVSTDVEAFKAALAKYVEDVQQLTATRQSEPNIVAGALMPFLQAVPLGYNCRPHSQKGQSGIDLAILSGKDVTVIIEAKAVGSKDMITAHDLNKKAFHEAIFYFMQERSRKNYKLAHIVITDFQEWYVFDAKDFERLFWGNSQLKKAFEAYHNPNLLTTSTAEVYAAIAEELPRILKDLFTEAAIDCAYFSLAASHIGKGGLKDKELTAIYKLLSPDSLLKGFNPNDANSLKPAFYNELLYILGLKEVKEGGKKLIQAAGTVGSLYDGIADKLDQKGAPHEFEDVIKLIIIWINRVLFLKLLESQIVTWTDDKDKSSRFLHAGKISGYDALENLFFDTLARRIPDRKNKGFDYIPYLNSSLFEMQDEERTGISISALPDDAQLAYYGNTVVKDAATKRKAGKVNTLAYLFEFLDAYNFANDSGHEVVAETKTLISASVLGLIFEKINGYKDGSFYTPSFVTMYMARQTIEKAVLQKFNEAYSWTCTALKGEGGLKNELKDHKVKKTDSNALIDSLKICDPAVGSGHFLVSALNEILYIKSLLGLLVDEAGDVLDYDIVIENDELIVTSDKGELFEYKKGSKEKTLVQKTLFQEKQKIIENCLFGVDINPNSVNICRLRLWIELLKNAYYQPNGELETLPNIDINIKCGNSLISRFALDTDLKAALRASKISVDEYRTAVSDYRNTSDKAEKRKIEALIESIKTNFRKEIEYLHIDPKQKRFIELPRIIKALETTQSVLGETVKEEKERKQKQAKLKSELEKLSTEVQDIKTSKIYQNAFEWRFEFPEVMDEEGEFVGFDVVIGNPPYIDSEAMVNKGLEAERKFIVDNYLTAKGNWDIYVPFFEKGLALTKANQQFAFITSDIWLSKNYGIELRKQLIPMIWEIVNTGRAVFDSADLGSVLTFIQKAVTVNLHSGQLNTDGYLQLNTFNKKVFEESPYKLDYIFSKNTKILSKLNAIDGTLKDIAVCENACSTADCYRLVDILDELAETNKEKPFFKVINSGTIDKFSDKWGKKQMTYLKSKYLNPIVEKAVFLEHFSNSYGRKTELTKIIVKGLRKLDACLDLDASRVPGKSTLVIPSDNTSHLKFLSTVINSKLAFFYLFEKHSASTYNGALNFTKDMLNELPIPKLNEIAKKPFIIKVDSILKAKSKGVDTAALEREIDDMVYRLYGLTYDEVKTIEPEYSPSREEYEAVA